MNAKDVIAMNIDLSEMVVNSYLKDLSDEEIRLVPVNGMNPIAWQLGHLLSSERYFVEMIAPGKSPALPDGFDVQHPRDPQQVPDPSKFYSVARYQELLGAQRNATRAVLSSLGVEDLDRTDDRFPQFAPSVGAIMNLCAGHPLMHAGQFVAVRRHLGKPNAI